MLKNRLTNIPHTLLLRSDKILYLMLQEILEESKYHYDDKFDEIFDAIRDFYPNNYRLDEMEFALSQESIKDSGIESNYDYTNFKGKDYNFDFLDELFEEFFEQDGTHIYVKDEQIENYLSYINKISPFCLVGNYLAKSYISGDIDINTILAYIDSYTPLALYIDKDKEYAENHIHLKGAGYLAFNFINILSHKTPKDYYKKEFIKELPRINEFSYLNNHTLSIGQMIDILKLSQEYIFTYAIRDKLIKDQDEINNYRSKLQKILKLNRNISPHRGFNIEHFYQMSKILPIGYSSDLQKLFTEMIEYYKNDEYNKACLIESILIFYLHNIASSSNHNELRVIIKIFIHTLNILRSYMVMSQNLGLSHFSEFNRSIIRQIERKDTCNSASSIIRSGTTHLNAKIGNLKSASDLSNRLQEFINIFETKIEKDGDLKFNFTLCAIKGREKDITDSSNSIYKPRFFYKRLDLKKETLALDDFLRGVEYKIVKKHNLKLRFDPTEAIKTKVRDENIFYDLSQYVVAIDAVGKETHTPPEVFAPYFRYLRNMPKRLKNHIFPFYTKIPHHPNLIFSVHAGEDFNHIVTGMRRVDEAIKFFEMKRKDRLGHLLSIGITPQEWIANYKEIILSKGDYFDDLVWITTRLKELPNVSNSIYRYINIYTDRIWELFREIYSNYKGEQPKLKDLYEAWLYRKNCPINYFRRKRGEVLFSDYDRRVLEKEPSSNRVLLSDRDKIVLNKESLSIVQKLYELYHIDPNVRKEYSKHYKVSPDNILEDELEIWEIVQDSLINDIGKIGIVVETNPSSNLFISSMRSYKNHPIFRFNPPKEHYLNKGERFNKYGLREGSISVTINSDDPSIFVTSLQNEYRAIRSILKENFLCTDKEAESYIEEIRRFGIKLFEESYIIKK